MARSSFPMWSLGIIPSLRKFPPKDHLLSAHPAQNITVREGETAEVTFDNDPYGELRVEKISNTGEKLAGVHVQIKHIESGRTYSGFTEPSGVVQFTNLKPGAYEVQEIAGIPGWKADTDTVKTITVVTGQTSTVTFTNKELPGLRIEKYDSSSNKALSGITFRIWRDGELLDDYRTGELGEILIPNLQPGTYWSRKSRRMTAILWIPRPSRLSSTLGTASSSSSFSTTESPASILSRWTARTPPRSSPTPSSPLRRWTAALAPRSSPPWRTEPLTSASSIPAHTS